MTNNGSNPVSQIFLLLEHKHMHTHTQTNNYNYCHYQYYYKCQYYYHYYTSDIITALSKVQLRDFFMLYIAVFHL